jgi:hypothetical protein
MKKKLDDPTAHEVLVRQCDELSKFIREHEERQHIMFGGDLVTRLRQVLQQYDSIAVRALAGAKSFRDDVIVTLRAVVMYLDTVGDGYTHKEKAARLRGLIELLEKQMHSLRGIEFDFSKQWHHYDDVFRSDFPYRELMDRIYSLEAENKALKGEKEPSPAQTL